MPVKNVSVLIPAYNNALYIGTAVKSLLNQSFRDLEILIIDDGSTDCTEEVISKIKDSRINYVYREHSGVSGARNYGLNKASNEWVAFLDADDISHPDRIKKQVEMLNNSAPNTLICTDVAYFSGSRILYTIEAPSSKEILFNKLALHAVIYQSSVLFNRNYVLEKGGYNETLSIYEDYDLWLRLMHDFNFVSIPEILVFARVRKDSLSNKDKIDHRRMVLEIQKQYYKDLAGIFNIADQYKQAEIRGWREYFFGDKNNARLEWRKIPLMKRDLRVIIAYLTTYMNDQNLYEFRENRVRLRIKYLLNNILKSDHLNDQLLKCLE